MEAARFIVCEKSSRWANAIRRACGGRCQLPLRETRSLRLCRESCLESPASFLTLELRPDNGEQLVLYLCDLWSEFPRAKCVVVAERGLREWQWPLREAGALLFVDSPRRVAEVVRLAERHLRRVAPQTLSGAPFWRRFLNQEEIGEPSNQEQ